MDTGPVATEAPEALSAPPAPSTWLDYLRPLRVDHWIKNLVVPVGSLLALAAARFDDGWNDLGPILLAFVVSGLVSSVNYAVNEVLDAPFDARHPTKRERPIPSGRVRIGPLLGLTAAVALLAFGLGWWLLPPPAVAGAGALFLAGLAYNLPPIRLKDRPYLDVVAEALTNPIRIAIGWYAVSSAAPPVDLLATVWAFGAFLMTGKRLAELRLLGALAAHYRPTFAAYSVTGLFVVQLGYALAGLGTLAWLVVTERPAVLPGVPLVAGLLVWALKMTFEPSSPLIDPEHLYRRPVFLLVSVAVFAVLVKLALG
jgi:4-hydroxybenzoate polyprenyltransferase